VATHPGENLSGEQNAKPESTDDHTGEQEHKPEALLTNGHYDHGHHADQKCKFRPEKLGYEGRGRLIGRILNPHGGKRGDSGKGDCDNACQSRSLCPVGQNRSLAGIAPVHPSLAHHYANKNKNEERHTNLPRSGSRLPNQRKYWSFHTSIGPPKNTSLPAEPGLGGAICLPKDISAGHFLWLVTHCRHKGCGKKERPRTAPFRATQRRRINKRLSGKGIPL
jgi:hypothetical protein